MIYNDAAQAPSPETPKRAINEEKVVELSSKVKQANFRLPLEYMDLIDEFSKRGNMTKAAVITRALDCMKASYDSGNNGMPVKSGGSSVSEEQLTDLKKQLTQAETRAEESVRQADEARNRAASAERARDAAEARANDAVVARDAAESKVREMAIEMAAAPKAAPEPASIASDAELNRLRELLARQERQLAEKDAAIADRDARIAVLTEQLGAANAKAELALKNINVEAVTLDDPNVASDEPTRALAMLNMIGGVMNAFQQQVDDARAVGEQEGRMAVRKELQETIEKARNDGYRDAMGYLDDRVTTARDTGAREERARIANMTFFERRRYLRMHIA